MRITFKELYSFGNKRDQQSASYLSLNVHQLPWTPLHLDNVLPLRQAIHRLHRFCDLFHVRKILLKGAPQEAHKLQRWMQALDPSFDRTIVAHSSSVYVPPRNYSVQLHPFVQAVLDCDPTHNHNGELNRRHQGNGGITFVQWKLSTGPPIISLEQLSRT